MRWWNETVAIFDDVIPFGLAAPLSLLLAAIVGVLWHTFPAWLPGRWRLGSRKRGREPDLRIEKADRSAVDEDQPEVDELPPLAPEVYLSQADRYAAEGRWAEAVRERLRAMVRELVDRGVVEHVPGWTVTELARAAGGTRPELGPALDGATRIFSGIWYAQRPATAGDDELMRGHLATVHELVRGGR
ncbi:hypothetical protein Cme02nite_18320 [Catellatospora methionotrophica]|uniref:Protein-glutamine gamma-glutamyltransferase-like C-terminal domain-containing protein n=1 Tax=Catellatospora methionotrophica TaxID=121620 RepID=A0A8J3LIY7_9ACTN|nr:DUF4129 domain-containing protein [Catellatospora methionotrophica]GIG13500.1 hypothetical protein Cme02nite_18320 [Catellatospora methionotrophica]